MKNKMWGGRFTEAPDAIMEEINASIDFDKALAPHDIAGSRAHAEMLAEKGIISAKDAREIVAGLNKIASEIERGDFTFSRALEDIHMNVEARLKAMIGEPAGRLHTARSRNDQVATDLKLWVRDAIDRIDDGIHALQSALAAKAEEHADAVMPGFTHLQIAQPVTFGHHLLAYVEMLARDRGRFADCRRRLNKSPLGAAALAGTAFPIDRKATSRALGFDRPAANSLDAVSDRDFALEALAATSIAAIHLSRLAEEIVIWCSAEFGFVRFSDRFTTGSSIMPQKRNPDAAELVRAKSGRIVGALTALLVVMKGLPLAYSKDMQEDKEQVFDALSTLSLSLAAMTGMVRDMEPNRDAMRAAAGAGYATATDLADWLVREAGLPFREAHEVTGRVVKEAAKRNVGARGHAPRRADGDPPGDHEEGLRRAFGRCLGGKPHQRGRHRTEERAQGRARLDQAPCGRGRGKAVRRPCDAESGCVSGGVRYSRKQGYHADPRAHHPPRRRRRPWRLRAAWRASSAPYREERGSGRSRRGRRPVRGRVAPRSRFVRHWREGGAAEGQQRSALLPRLPPLGLALHHFLQKEGVLHAEGVPVPKIAANVGTPFYCYSTATLTRHYRVFDEAFASLDHLICYSLKANSNQAVVATLGRLGAGADVVSEGELRRALAAGIPGDKIVFSGVGKTAREIAFGLEAGIHCFNVESEGELLLLSELATARGVEARASLRINPDVDARTHEKISTGRKENKFGVPFSRARAVCATAATLPGIRVVGVDVHIGSQLTELQPFDNAFRLVSELVVELRADGHKSSTSISAAGSAFPTATTRRRRRFRPPMPGSSRST